MLKTVYPSGKENNTPLASICDSLELVVILQYTLELLAHCSIVNSSYDYSVQINKEDVDFYTKLMWLDL